jgi:hypothetical protein
MFINIDGAVRTTRTEGMKMISRMGNGKEAALGLEP